MTSETDIKRHEDLQRRVLEEAEKWPPWALSYDIRKELRDAGVQPEQNSSRGLPSPGPGDKGSP